MDTSVKTNDLSDNAIVDASKNITSDASSNGWTEEHFKIIKYVCSRTHLTEEQAMRGLTQYKGDYNKVIQVATMHHLIGIVMRQTTYTFKEAAMKLQEFNGEPVDVIKDFMGTSNTKIKKEIPKTTNQMVFSEIRNFMDDVNKGYNIRKQRAEQIKKIQEKLNKAQ
jgi:hypothetical protein